MKVLVRATLLVVMFLLTLTLIGAVCAGPAHATTYGSQVVLSVAPGNYTPLTPVSVPASTAVTVWTNPNNQIGSEIALLKLAPAVGGSNNCTFAENATASANSYPLYGGFDWNPSSDRVPSKFVSVYCPTNTTITGSQGY